jgi:hypothetical protein
MSIVDLDSSAVTESPAQKRLTEKDIIGLLIR